MYSNLPYSLSFNPWVNARMRTRHQVITFVVCSIALNICLLSFGVLFGIHGDAHLPEWAKIAEEDAVAAL